MRHKKLDWQDSVIIGSIIGGTIIIGIIFIFDQKRTESPVIISKSPSTSFSKNLPSSIGWIRIGAINNRSGVASVGESLIATNQPITISPPIVPSIGNQVSITNNIDVNLRNTFPKPPNYKLEQKTNVLISQQKLVILEIKSFVDPTVSSSYTTVWAEVDLP